MILVLSGLLNMTSGTAFKRCGEVVDRRWWPLPAGAVSAISAAAKETADIALMGDNPPVPR